MADLSQRAPAGADESDVAVLQSKDRTPAVEPAIEAAKVRFGERRPGISALALLLEAGEMRRTAFGAGLNGPPLEPADFVAWHYLFFLNDGGRLRPVGGFRGISLHDCVQNGLDFGSICGVKRASESEDLLRSWIDEHKAAAKSLVYHSEFCVRPEFHRTQVSRLVHELSAAMVAMEYKSGATSTALTNGTAASDRFFQRVGWIPAGRTPGPAPKGAETRLMKMSRPSQYAIDCLDRHRAILGQLQELE